MGHMQIMAVSSVGLGERCNMNNEMQESANKYTHSQTKWQGARQNMLAICIGTIRQINPR